MKETNYSAVRLSVDGPRHYQLAAADSGTCACSSSMEQAWTISDYHQYVPTFALSSGLRMWIKLIMSKTHFLDDSTHTEFKVEVNTFTVAYYDARTRTDLDRVLMSDIGCDTLCFVWIVCPFHIEQHQSIVGQCAIRDVLCAICALLSKTTVQ